MGAVKSMMMDVEDFVYDFYSSDGELMESPKVIIEKAIEKFGWSFGSYAGEVIEKFLFSVFVIITLSGCSAIETSTQIYQMCKYQDRCPVEVLGDWLNGK